MLLSGKVIVVEEVGGVRRAYVQDVEQTEIARADTEGSGCQVTGTLDDNGDWIDGPRCVSSGCSGTCELNQSTNGAKTSYWCECR